MFTMREWSTSTWIAALLRGFLPSTPRVESLACPRCGLVIAARVEVGTSSSGCAISLNQPKQSRCSVYLGVTNDGKLSISCACSVSDAHRYEISSGKDGGISFTRESSEAQPCGCDPGLRIPAKNKREPQHYVCAMYPECAYGRSVQHLLKRGDPDYRETK